MKNIKYTFIFLFAVGGLFSSCSAKLAAGSETDILTFKFEEYPDNKYLQSGYTIVSTMPIEKEDLHLTPIFTLSRGATSTPKSGEVQDFGYTTPIGVTSEDNLYYTTYYVTLNYPSSTTDFSKLAVSGDNHLYGEDFSLLYAKFKSELVQGGVIEFNSFAQSNHAPLAEGVVPSDISTMQFYPNAPQKGKSIAVATSYDINTAATINFTRPVDIDTFTFTPSALTVFTMKNGYSGSEGGSAFTPISSGDYVKICFAGYDADGVLVGTKEEYLADYRYAENTYIHEGKQIFTLLPTKMKSIKKLKIYFTSNRSDFFPVFFLDGLTYKVQPQPTDDDDE
ncbi:MAG: DUF4465 domain-containing protein [Flavobacteriales bacterium]|nr:DUF4465 domain-containing protein [Flavobacteriales bacterium]